MRIRLCGGAVQFLTFTGPFLAEPAKVWLLRNRGLGTQHAVAATIAEYLSYTFTSAALAVARLTYLLGNFQLSNAMTAAAKTIIIATCAFLAASAYAIVFRIYLIGAIVQGVRRMPLFGKRLPFSDQDLREVEDLPFAVWRDRPLHFFSILAMEFAAQALLVLEVLVFLRSAAPTFALLDAFVIEGATKYVGLTFLLIPAQVGASEGAYALIFKAVGLPASAGFVLALVQRLRSLLIAGVGLVLALRG